MSEQNSDELLACTQCGSGHYSSDAEEIVALKIRLEIATEALKRIKPGYMSGDKYAEIAKEALAKIELTQ